jgi:hypothetical protein
MRNARREFSLLEISSYQIEAILIFRPGRRDVILQSNRPLRSKDVIPQNLTTPCSGSKFLLQNWRHRLHVRNFNPPQSRPRIIKDIFDLPNMN